MPHLVLNLDVAPRENCAVLAVASNPGGLGRHMSATAMALCKICKEARKRNGDEPRPLFRLPLEITQDKIFKRKGLPVHLCEECDGDVVKLAMQAHKQRVDK